MMSQARSSLEPIRVKPSSSGPDKRPRTVFRLLLLCLGFFPAAGFADRPEQAKPSDVPCLECHDDVSARIEAGAHGRAGLTCVDCHAGLKGAADFPHPVQLNKADCLSCHTQRSQDSERSFHRPGQATEGRPVPDCAGCHGRHDIRGAGDPQSRIHYRFRGEGDEQMHVRAWLDDKQRIMAVAIHNSDVSDGWEREGENDEYFHRYSEKIAYPLGINLVVYLMTH